MGKKKSKIQILSDDDPYKALREQVWEMRLKGETWQSISDAVGKSITAVRYHYDVVRKQAGTEMRGRSSDEVLGEIGLKLQSLTHEAQRNMALVMDGSPMKATWIDVVGRRVRDEIKFALDTGLIQRAADRIDLNITDVRSMSTDQLKERLQRIQTELKSTELDAPQAITTGQTAPTD